MNTCTETDNFSLCPAQTFPSLGRGQGGTHLQQPAQPHLLCSGSFPGKGEKAPPNPPTCQSLPSLLASALAQVGATSKLQVTTDRRVKCVDSRARLPV